MLNVTTPAIMTGHQGADDSGLILGYETESWIAFKILFGALAGVRVTQTDTVTSAPQGHDRVVVAAIHVAINHRPAILMDSSADATSALLCPQILITAFYALQQNRAFDQDMSLTAYLDVVRIYRVNRHAPMTTNTGTLGYRNAILKPPIGL